MVNKFVLPDLTSGIFKEEEVEAIEKVGKNRLNLEDYFPEGHGSAYQVDGWVDNFHLDRVLSYGLEWGASDVHITSGQEVAYTILGQIEKAPEFGIPEYETVQDLITEILSHILWGNLSQNFDLDTSYVLKFGPYKGRRCRLNIGKTFGTFFMVFRLISDEIPSVETLGIDNELIEWSQMSNGVWLVCGSTGTGKTTTLASIIRNRLEDPIKVITIEKPIEFIYPKDTPGLIIQREVGEEGSDVRSFSDGLTAAMREAPDIIMIGEVRNQEEVQELIRAAETGHLAVSTMHTNAVPTTINRIISLFDGGEQKRIMSTLSDTLRGVCNQILVRTIDGKSRFAIREILPITEEIKHYISKGDVGSIRNYMKDRGMMMEQKILKAYLDEKIDLKEARRVAPDLTFFNELLQEVEL